MKRRLAALCLTLSLLTSENADALICFYGGSYPCISERLMESPEFHTGACDKGCGYLVSLEGLCWTIFQNGLDYAVDFDEDHLLGNGKIHTMDYNWTGGVRGSLGTQICGLDVKAVYTWFQNDAHGHESDQDLKPTLLHPAIDQINATFAKARLQLEYQTFDLLFGRQVCLWGGRVTLHPFLGPRFLKIDQDLKAKYEGGDFEETAKVDWDSTLEGAGLVTGFDVHYRWVYGWGIYGSSSFSILASRTDNRHRQNDAEDEDLLVIDLHEKEHIGTAGYHLQAGIIWETAFCCTYLRFKAAYEFNRWFNTPQMRRYQFENHGASNSGTEGGIGLHGAIVGIDLYF